MSIFKIRSYKKYKGVGIYRDPNIYGEEQVYIGNGQGCDTFWFKNVKQAQKFIDKYRDRIQVNDFEIVSGLIPKELCKKCKGHYSYQTEEWKKCKDNVCEEYKERLKKEMKNNV